MKNVDRNSATYHSVTVDDFTVVITEFKPKVKKEKKDAKTPGGLPGNDKNGDGGGGGGPSKNGNSTTMHEKDSKPKQEPGGDAGPGGGNAAGPSDTNAGPIDAGGDMSSMNNHQNNVTTTNHRVEVLSDTRSS